MNVSICVDNEIVDTIEKAVSEKIEGIVNDIIGQNIDAIIEDTVKKQLKSVALMYIQSPELRRKLQNKVQPLVDSILEGKND